MSRAHVFGIAALVSLGLSGLLLVLASGNLAPEWSGLQHLIMLTPVFALMWLGWKHPLSAGWLVVILAFFILGAMYAGPPVEMIWYGNVIVWGLLLVPAILFFLAANARGTSG